MSPEKPLVERAAELTRLLRALAAPPSVVVVEGEAGIGKTRLVGEALDLIDSANCRVLAGQAHPLRDPFPLGPVLEALAGADLPAAAELNPVVGALAPLLPERSRSLPPAPPKLDEPSAERHRVIRGITELLRALGRCVVVLEDLHWADDRTLELLTVLAQSPPPELSLLLTTRSDETEARRALDAALAASRLRRPPLRIALEPLSDGGLAELVQGWLGAPLSPGTGQRLARYTSGIPFLIEETVRLLKDRDLLRTHDGVWSIPDGELDVPPAAAQLIGARVARISDGARRVSEAIAVLGQASDEQLLCRLLDEPAPAVAAMLTEAIDAGLVIETGGRFDCRHPLARQAILDAISTPWKRMLHLAAARALEAGGDQSVLGRVAEHYRLAGDDAAWLRSTEQAAAALVSRGEDRLAFDALHAVLEAGVVPPERVGALTVQMAWAGHPHTAVDAERAHRLRQALGLGGLDRGMRGELRLLLGWSLLRSGEGAEGIATVTAALDDLDERPGLAARALSTLALPWLPEGTVGEHLDHLAAARSRAALAEDPLVDAAVAVDAVTLLAEIGDPDMWSAVDALPPLGRSPRIDQQHLRGLLNVAHSAIDLGHYDRALDLVRRAQEARTAYGIEAFEWGLGWARLLVRWATGDLTPEEAARVTEEAATGGGLDVELLSAEIRLDEATVREARAMLERVAADARALGQVTRSARATATWLRTYDRGPAGREALQAAERVVEWAVAKEALVWIAPLLPVLPVARIVELLPGFSEAARQADAPLATVASLLAEARVAEHRGQAEAAAARQAEARALASRLPDPRLAARIGVGEARLRHALGESERARQLFAQSEQALIGLGARWELGRARGAMRACGIHPGPTRRGRRGYADELSPREREIAGRAVTGLTAREIAAELHLSPRTVEGHLARAMGKLRISSRRDLAGAIAAHEARGPE